MATTKPRITITLEPHVYEVLSRLSAVSHKPMSAIVSQFVDVAAPSLERVVVVLERAKAAPQETLAGVAASVERASRDVIQRLQEAMGQGDMFLDEMARRMPADAPGKARGAPARGGARAARGAGAGAGQPPVPVTRGVGTVKTRRAGA